VSATPVEATASATPSGCSATAGSRVFSVKDKPVSFVIYSAPRFNRVYFHGLCSLRDHFFRIAPIQAPQMHGNLTRLFLVQGQEMLFHPTFSMLKSFESNIVEVRCILTCSIPFRNDWQLGVATGGSYGGAESARLENAGLENSGTGNVWNATCGIT